MVEQKASAGLGFDLLGPFWALPRWSQRDSHVSLKPRFKGDRGPKSEARKGFNSEATSLVAAGHEEEIKGPFGYTANDLQII